MNVGDKSRILLVIGREWTSLTKARLRPGSDVYSSRDTFHRINQDLGDDGLGNGSLIFSRLLSFSGCLNRSLLIIFEDLSEINSQTLCGSSDGRTGWKEDARSVFACGVREREREREVRNLTVYTMPMYVKLTYLRQSPAAVPVFWLGTSELGRDPRREQRPVITRECEKGGPELFADRGNCEKCTAASPASERLAHPEQSALRF